MANSKQPGLFKVNDNLEVATGSKQDYYKTIVQEVGRQSITIGLPMLNAQGLLLREGEKLQIRKVEEDAIYLFTGRVTSRMKNDNVPLYGLQISQDYKRIQRRNYVRISSILPLEYRIKQEDSEFISTNTVDISGGGMKFVSDTGLQPGDLLEVKLQLDNQDIRARGKVIRTEKFKDKKDNMQKLFICLEFVQIKEMDREKIISYIFKKIRDSI